MSPPVLKSQLLCIPSTFITSGTPDNFTTFLPAGVLQNPYGGRTKITVVDFIINTCFYSIRESSDQSINSKTTVVICLGFCPTKHPVFHL